MSLLCLVALSEAAPLQTRLHKAVLHVERATGLTVGDLTLYECSSTSEFTSLTGFRWFKAAAFARETLYLQPAELLEERNILDGVLRHELFHAAARGLGIPYWLEEGLAVYVSGELAAKPQAHEPEELKRMFGSEERGEFERAYRLALEYVLYDMEQKGTNLKEYIEELKQ